MTAKKVNETFHIKRSKSKRPDEAHNNEIVEMKR